MQERTEKQSARFPRIKPGLYYYGQSLWKVRKRHFLGGGFMMQRVLSFDREGRPLLAQELVKVTHALAEQLNPVPE